MEKSPERRSSRALAYADDDAVDVGQAILNIIYPREQPYCLIKAQDECTRAHGCCCDL